MIGVTGSMTWKEPNGTSRVNSHYIHHGTEALISLLISSPLIVPTDIMIVTPYLKQVRLWREVITKYQVLDGVGVMSTDSMQGWERRFVLWDQVMAYSPNTSFGFLANDRRICLSISRHSDGFIILGDSTVSTPLSRNTTTVAEAIPEAVEELEGFEPDTTPPLADVENLMQFDRKYILGVLNHVRTRQRIITIPASPIAAPLCEIVTLQSIRRETGRIQANRKARDLALEKQGWNENDDDLIDIGGEDDRKCGVVSWNLGGW